MRPIGSEAVWKANEARVASRAREAARSELADSVQVRPARAVLASLGERVASSCTLAMLSAPVATVVERAQGNGVAFWRPRKFLFWKRDDWKPAKPAEVAKAMAKGKADEVRVTVGSSAPAPVRSSDDLEVIDALYGAGDLSALETPAVGEALRALEKAGANIEAGGHVESAYEAYRSGCARIDGQAVADGESAVALACMRGLVKTTGLSAPTRAESLLALQSAGCRLSVGSAFEAYEALRSQDVPVDVRAHDVTVACVTRADLDDGGFPRRLTQWLSDLDCVRKRFPDPASAWLTLQAGPERAMAERADLLQAARATSTSNPPMLYGAVLGSAAPTEALTDAARDLLALARALPPQCTDEAVDLYRSLRLADPAERQRVMADLLAAAPDFRRILSHLDAPPDVRARVLGALTPIAADARKALADRVQAAETWDLGQGWAHEPGTLTGGADRYSQAHGYATCRFSLPPGRHTLRMDVARDLERYDSAGVEVSSDGGKTWGASEPIEKSGPVTVSLYGGPDVAVRIRVSKTYAGGGLRVANPAVDGTPLDRLLGQRELEPLLAVLEDDALDAQQRSAAVRALVDTALPLRDALRAWTVLRPSDPAGWPDADFTARVDLLAKLAKQGGIDAALAAWPSLTSLAPSARPAVIEQATKLVDALGDRSAGVRLVGFVVGHPGDPAVVEGLAAVVKRLGATDAAKAWAVVEAMPGPWPQRVQVLMAALDLSPGALDDGVRDASAWRGIASVKAAVDALSAYAAESPGWTKGGQWAEERGAAGARAFRGGHSPLYQEHDSLTSDAFEVPARAVLAFNESHQFYAGDECRLQVRPEGGEWGDLMLFNDRADLQPQRADLSAYAGRRVQVRFKMSKMYDTTRGLYVEDVRLGYVPVDRLTAAEARRPVNALLVDPAVPLAERAKRLAALSTLTEKAGSATAGVRLWGALGTKQDLLPRMTALLDLVGPEGTLNAWPGLASLAPDRADAALASLRVLQESLKKDNRSARDAWPMLETRLGDPDFPAIADAAGRLIRAMGPADARRSWATLPEPIADAAGALEFCQRAGIPPMALPAGVGRHMGGLLDDVHVFDLQGRWQEERSENGGTVWNCATSPLYQEHSAVTSRPLILRGLASPVLRLEERHALADYDRCALEWSPDGTTWTSLREFRGTGAWTPAEVPLPQVDEIRLRMRMEKMYNTGDGLAFRNVSVANADGEERGLVRLSHPTRVDGLLRVASEPHAPDRDLALSVLAGMPGETVEKVLAFCEAHVKDGAFPKHTYGEIVARLANSAILGSSEDIESRLARLLAAPVTAGRVEVGDRQVVIDGIRVGRRPGE